MIVPLYLENGVVCAGLQFSDIPLLYLFHNIQLEWHCIA